jgi:hypothetical protein
MSTNNQNEPCKSTQDIFAQMMEQQTKRANLKAWEKQMKKHKAQNRNLD